jgi:hypothetical protein
VIGPSSDGNDTSQIGNVNRSRKRVVISVIANFAIAIGSPTFDGTCIEQGACMRAACSNRGNASEVGNFDHVLIPLLSDAWNT